MIHAWRLVLLSAILFVFSPLGCQGSLKVSINETEIDFGLFKTLEISLPSQLSYKISCKLVMDSDTFSVNPWTHDSMDVPEETDPSSLQSQTIAFYENKHIDKNTLYINNFDSTLSGNYTCHSAKNTTSLIITEGNPAILLLNKYEERTGGTGGSFVVNYFFLSNPSQTDFNYTWLYEGVPIVDETIYIQKFFKSFVVDVTGAYKKEHAGVYTLVVVTSLGTTNDSFTLQVFKPLSIVSVTLSPFNCLHQDTINMIQCIVTALPDPSVKFQLFSDDVDCTVIDCDTAVSIEGVVTTANLTFGNVSASNEGAYVCVAENTAQADPINKQLIAAESPLVKYCTSPIITLKSNDSVITANTDTSITLQCRVESIPTISTVVWYKDGVLVEDDSNHIDISMDGILFELELIGVFVNDTGLYVCSFNNTAIPLTVNETINITVLPEAPTNSPTMESSFVTSTTVLSSSSVTATVTSIPTISQCDNPLYGLVTTIIVVSLLLIISVIINIGQFIKSQKRNTVNNKGIVTVQVLNQVDTKSNQAYGLATRRQGTGEENESVIYEEMNL